LHSSIFWCVFLRWLFSLCFLLSPTSQTLQDGKKASTSIDSPVPRFLCVGLTARSSKICGSKNLQKYSSYLFHRWVG
jgi:hypothetical protein